MEKIIIGRRDTADFPSFGLSDVPVKVDTGAYTSSIHCDFIDVIEKDGKTNLEIRFFDHNDLIAKTYYFDKFKEKIVRSSSGEGESRYFIEGEIVLFNKTYKTQFSLTKRRRMKFPVLLGRKLLNKNFIVDSGKVYLSKNNKIHTVINP
jgi:hypothetical protein